MHRLSIVVLLPLAILATATSGAQTRHDDFHHLSEINMASLVMLVEERVVPEDLAREIARGMTEVFKEQAMPGSERSSNYLDFEARLLEIAGAEASRLHTGRSRQDMGSTYRRMALRESLLTTYASMLEAHEALLDLASGHVDTIIPAYTHGVQAQPTSLAHYLLAFSSAFERDVHRLQAAYASLNRSPMGAAVIGTSGFPLNRHRLAELLGFDGVVENSYDANLVSSVDSKIEFVDALSTSAIMVGQLMQNLHTQYHAPRPWIILVRSKTDVSSIMPQKRNPRPLDAVRSGATAVVGGTHLVTLNAHNTNSGMHDYRPGKHALETSEYAREMYSDYVSVLQNVVVDADRALEEVNADYSTMTEVADVLLREAEVPFRTAHHYASELTSYGKREGKRPIDLGNAELERIYEEAIGEPLPIPVSLIAEAMDPRAMVRNRRGLGGPQPDEVQRMLSEHRNAVADAADWLDGKWSALQHSADVLDQKFAELKR